MRDMEKKEVTSDDLLGRGLELSRDNEKTSWPRLLITVLCAGIVHLTVRASVKALLVFLTVSKL